MRTKGQYAETTCSRCADRSLPIHTLCCDVDNYQCWQLIATRGEPLLKVRQVANSRYFHLMVPQRITYLHGEEQIFFQCKNSHHYSYSPNLRDSHKRVGGSNPPTPD